MKNLHKAYAELLETLSVTLDEVTPLLREQEENKHPCPNLSNRICALQEKRSDLRDAIYSLKKVID